MEHITGKLFVAAVLAALGWNSSQVGQPTHPFIPNSVGLLTSPSDAASFPRQAEPMEFRVGKAELWWRIRMYEWDHGEWRYAGAFENPDRHRCIRYGKAWNEGKAGYRTYSGPFGFRR
jgi:hypothetical protein